MKSISRTFPMVAAGALVVAIALPSSAQAQGAPRGGSLEFILPVTYSQSFHVNGQGGSSADVNSNLGLGFGIAYNLNNHVQLGGTFNWTSRNYQATTVDATNPAITKNATGYLEASTIGFSGTFFFTPSGISPFVSAGIGSTFIDTNIPNGIPSTGCYWDPWYGQICSTYVPTKTQTAVSYTAGAGVRFELNRSFFMQASYNRMWIDLSSGTPNLDNWRLDFVFRM